MDTVGLTSGNASVVQELSVWFWLSGRPADGFDIALGYYRLMCDGNW